MEAETNDDDEAEIDVEVASNDELERQAVKEIMREAERAAERAKEIGATGWLKPRIPSTNKTFLRNTLVSTLRDPYKKKNKNKDFTSRFPDPTNYNRSQHKYQNKNWNYHNSKWREKPYNYPPEHFSEYPPEYAFRTHYDQGYRPEFNHSSFNHGPEHIEPRSDPRLDYKSAKGHDSDSLSSFTDESQHTPEGGYVYDAYEYGFQGSKESKKPATDTSKYGCKHEEESKSSDHKHPRTHSHHSRSKHKKSHHGSSKSSDRSHTSNNHKSRKRNRTPSISESSEDSYHEHKKKKKSKKKHKHKSKHKSKHKRKEAHS